MSLGELQKVPATTTSRAGVDSRHWDNIGNTRRHGLIQQEPNLWLEAVRHNTWTFVIKPLLNDQGELRVVTLDTTIEDECLRGSNSSRIRQLDSGRQVTLAVAC